MRGTCFDFGVDGGHAGDGRRSGRQTGDCRREPLPFPRVPPPIRVAEGLPSSHPRFRANPRAQAPSRSWADRVREIVPEFPLSGCSHCSQAEASHRPPGISRESQRESNLASRQEHVREEREAPTANGSRNFPATREQLSGNRQHLMSRQRDNITEVERDVNEDGWKVVHRQRRQRAHRQAREIMDPVQEGVCFRCLSQDHYASSCVSPIRCRLCRREGHRHAQCPLKVQGHEEE